ncbi:AAA family ATPase [Microbacterium sp. Mcb102]|uniref:AAA family ATPase n=1 Tax=Microbacterium sp. Mcb102 TaxID=2926012 RepID=UPI0021C92365|nr:ATP-binding protein [Microbacterium sp. Mcb102]
MTFSTVPTTEELPQFMVITGANGSGKSQFLQAISEGAIRGEWTYDQRRVVLLSSADLATQTSMAATGMTRRSVVDQFEQNVNSLLRPNGATLLQNLPNMLHVLRENWGMSEEAVRKAESTAGKLLQSWDHSDFVTFTPSELNQTMFQWSVADAFQRYSAMRTVNQLNMWLDSQGEPHDPWISKDDFVDSYGPEPWTVLNGVLAQLGLPYEFPAPSISVTEEPYVPRLKSTRAPSSISPEALSSGEKTLVQIALSAYSGMHRNEVALMPSVLLLDEPDATLHPSMVRSMLSLIQDILVAKLNVTVIITTHSPTTVALAPENALYVMEPEGEERLQKVSRDEALRRLLVGVPTVSVSAEHRRVVFTESPHDVDRYTAIFSALRPHIESERTLTFIAAGNNKSDGNGCAAVISMVDKLRENGNVSVWGLVDQDNRTSEPNSWVIFNDERYAIENLIFDPLSVGMLLLLDREAETIDAVPSSTGLQFRPEDAQALVDSVTARVLGTTEGSIRRVVAYHDHSEVSVDAAWLDMNGHDLEDLIVERVPHLKRYRHNNRFAATVIERVWAQDVRRIPLSVENTFLRLLDDET